MRAVFIALGLLAGACGGLAEGEYPTEGTDAGTDAAPLGQSEQAMISQVKNTDDTNQYLSGVMYEGAPLNGLTYRTTTDSDPSITWFVPRYKTLSFKVSKGACTTAQYDSLIAAVIPVINELNGSASIGSAGWALSYSTTTGTHEIRCHDLPVSTLGNSNIRSYSRTQCGTDFSRTIDDNGLPGVATHFSTCVIQVDVRDAQARGTSATEDTKLLWHAVAHGVIKLVGVGSTPGGANLKAGDETITPINTGRVMFSTGELCRTRNFATSQTSLFSISDTANCTNN